MSLDGPVRCSVDRSAARSYEARLARARSRLGRVSAAMVLCMLLSLSAPGSVRAETAHVRVSPDRFEMAINDEADLEIVIEDATNLYGMDLRLTFDAAVLEGVDADSGLGGVQATPGDLLYPDFVVRNQVDNNLGTIWYAVTQLNPREPANGSGTAMIVRFRAKSSGVVIIDLTNHVLVNSDGVTLDVTASGGEIVVPAPDGSIPDTPLPTSTRTLTPTSTATPQSEPDPQGEQTIPPEPTETQRPADTPLPPVTEPTSDSSYPGPTDAGPAATVAPSATAVPTSLVEQKTPLPTGTGPEGATPSAERSTSTPGPTRPVGAPTTVAQTAYPEPDRPTSSPEADDNTQSPTATVAKLAVVVPTWPPVPTALPQAEPVRPLVPTAIFNCMMVFVALSTLLLGLYLVRRDRIGPMD